jgi:hypothetical protein
LCCIDRGLLGRSILFEQSHALLCKFAGIHPAAGTHCVHTNLSSIDCGLLCRSILFEQSQALLCKFAGIHPAADNCATHRTGHHFGHHWSHG